MKRILLLALLCYAALLVAQHTTTPDGHESGGHGGGGMTGWKWANFAILAGGLGYLVAKKAPSFFNSRTAEIRKGITEAARMKADAEARAAEVGKKLADLGEQIEALRAEAKKEREAEHARLSAETAEQLAKIRSQGEQEIASAAKAARQELKEYSAELAVHLAEQRLRARMTTEAGRALVANFVKDLEHRRVN